MAGITSILAANIRRQFCFVIATAASTRCLVQNFQLLFCSQRVNAMSQYNDSGSSTCSTCSKWLNDPDGCSGETFLASSTLKKKLQRKMTDDYYWIGVQENVGMFSKSWSDRNSLILAISV